MTSATRVSNIVVFGKARKVYGGENERPKDVLTVPLMPLEKPPRPLKLAEVLDWTICHSSPPAVWLVTLRAWYRLGKGGTGGNGGETGNGGRRSVLHSFTILRVYNNPRLNYFFFLNLLITDASSYDQRLCDCIIKPPRILIFILQ